MAVCILGRHGVDNVLCDYISFNEPSSTFVNVVVLCEQDIGTFLAKYLTVKCIYAELKITKLLFSKAKKCFTLKAIEAIKNNVSAEELAEYETEVSKLLAYTKIYQSVPQKKMLEVISIVQSMDKVSNVFIHNYIKSQATLSFIVQEGMTTMKKVESLLEDKGMLLVFTCFLPVIDYANRVLVKESASKSFSNVIICLDKRELIYTKEDLDEIEHMKIEDPFNDNLVAYRYKRETKLQVEI